MSIAPRRLLSVLLLTLVLAWGGLLSAAHMAPSADEMARAQSVLALEPAPGSLCLSGDERHVTHHCPFCHALPRAPGIAIDPAVSRLVFAQSVAPPGPQQLVPQPARRAHAPRAPPLFLV
ncbi:MAG: hypothetical protein GYB53_11440 [Rhodobacteraceae bacterium]|nr:hypothetical protein [Paracoccaceae bacterium]MBR9820048.1 hypothetical protein [Paracoccaceae bacterium]